MSQMSKAIAELQALAKEHEAEDSQYLLGIANKLLEPVAGAVLGKIAVLVLLVLFIQRRPRGLFPVKGRAVET